MKRIALIVSIAAMVFASAHLIADEGGTVAFYLGTDKSFGADERAYVNLEGPGSRDYTFRVYRVKNVDEFLSKSVKGRLVKESNNDGYGNAITLFRETYDYFKSDFRVTARKELNARTRTRIKEAAGTDFDSSYSGERALPAFLEGHEFVASFSISATDEDWSYRKVPVPVNGSGVYLVEAVSGKDIGYTVVVKSSLTFLVKQSDSQTLIFAAKRESGTPVDGADVRIVQADSQKDLGIGKTSSGVFAFAGKTPPKSLIIVKKGGEYAVSDPDFYAKSFYGEGGIRTYIYTDRPVYRPGDTVSFKGIVRSFAGDDYSVKGGNATLRVVTDEGNEVVSGLTTTVSNDLGTFDGTFTLPNAGDQYLGIYNLVLTFNGKDYSTEFAVDAYRKPPFLVKVSTPKRSYIGSDTIEVTANAKFYYGGSVADADLSYRVFKKKKFDYSPVGSLPFFSEAVEYLGITNNATSDLVASGSGKTDSNGEFSFKVNPGKADEDYTFTAVVDVSTADATMSGAAAFSVNRSAFFIRAVKDLAVFSPGDVMKIEALLMPFDSTISAEDKTKLVSNRTVEAVLYTRSFAGISQEGERKKVDATDIKTNANGSAVFSFKLPKKGHYILVLKSKDPDGQQTVTESAFWVSGKSDSIEIPFKNITLKSSKDLYEVGEEADLLIMSPVADGTVFLTLEGNRILKHETVTLSGNTYRYKVKITPAMAPNFTVSAVQFARGDVYKNQIKVIAPPRDKFINVNVVPAKKEYKPGETAELTLETTSVKGGAVSAECSIAVVDEAIYQIREDQNPSITTYFYHPRTNNVSTTYSSAYRFFGYSEEKRLKLALQNGNNAPLAALKEEEEKSRERFKDTTYWTAKVTTGPDGKAVVKFPLADNITTWRVVAYAVTADTRVGQGRTQFLSRKKLMLQPGLPAYMIRGDQQTVVGTVTNLTNSKIDSVVKIQCENAVVVGDAEHSVSVDAGKSVPVYFTVKPSLDPKDEKAVVQIRAEGGGLSDGVKYRIPLSFFGRKTSLPELITLTDENDSGSSQIILPAKYADADLEIHLAPGSGEALRESLSYLADYPYGCIEQTMSRFMPLLAAKQAGYVTPRITKELPKMVNVGLKLIKSKQQNDGGFAWFGETESDAMMSAYVYRGLVISKKLFGGVDDYLLSRLRYRLYESLDSGSLAPFEKSYVVFCVSEGGTVEKSILDSIVTSARTGNAYIKALAAVTCLNMKDPRAKGLFEEGLREFGRSVSSNADTIWANDRVETGAILLTAAVRMGGRDAEANQLSEQLIQMRSGLAWKNSRDTAWAVIALSEKLKVNRENKTASNISVLVNGVVAQAVRITASEIDTGSTVIRVAPNLIKGGKNSITVKKTGGASVYATAVLSFVDRSDSFAPISKGFDITRQYYRVESGDSEGKISLSLKESAAFTAGDLIMVKLSVARNGALASYCMIEDALPPGFSPVKNDGEYYSADLPKEYTSRQYYDDRAVFFAKGPLNELTVRYFLRADLPGSYRSIPPTVSLMYYPGQYGSAKDDRLTIRARGDQ